MKSIMMLSWIWALSIFKNVPEEMKSSFICTVTVVEIQSASIKRDKVPGPDGYNSAFFQDNWDVVGSGLVQAN